MTSVNGSGFPKLLSQLEDSRLWELNEGKIMTRAVIHVIEQLGYAVRTRRTDDGPELFAMKRDNPAIRHTVKLNDPDDPEEQYRVACRLAQMVEIDLTDG